MNIWTFSGALILIAAALFFVFGFVSSFLRYRRTFVITCPDNYQPAAVKVDALDAGRWSALAGETALHLKSCTRWPDRADCGQDCLSQIATSAEACLVTTIVTAWYENKECVYCERPVGEIVWHERPPALRTPDGVTREWSEISPEQLPGIFRTAQPVCWHCFIVEGFRKDHPELVVERKRPEEPRVTLRPSLAVY